MYNKGFSIGHYTMCKHIAYALDMILGTISLPCVSIYEARFSTHAQIGFFCSAPRWRWMVLAWMLEKVAPQEGDMKTSKDWPLP
jgi:hypothetical protein